MTELSTASSFIVRVYRVDTEDPRKLAGQVENLDGSGARSPFTCQDELMAVLNGPDKRLRKSRRRTTKK